MLAIVLSASPAQANSLINNQATGIVEGNIIQKMGKGADSFIAVGAISIEGGSAKNIKVQGHVKGDIIVQSDRTTDVKIGSVIKRR